jgi:hypothetical protein
MPGANSHYEYKVVKAKALRKRDGAEAQERLLNELAAEGWELADARRADVWDFTSDSWDTLVLRRTA